METQLRDNPNSVLKYELMPPDPEGHSREYLWQMTCILEAAKELDPITYNKLPIAQKQTEYIDFYFKFKNYFDFAQRSAIDPVLGISYLISPNPKVLDDINIIADEFLAWFQKHVADRQFLQTPVELAFIQMLNERPDLLALLRIAQNLPPDSQPGTCVSCPPIEPTLLQDMIELYHLYLS